MWELIVTTATSFAAVNTRAWFDDEDEARGYYEQIKMAMGKKGWKNDSDLLEISARGGVALIKLNDVHAVTLNDLDVDTFEKLHVIRANNEAEAAKHVFEKFGEKTAEIWARMIS